MNENRGGHTSILTDAAGEYHHSYFLMPAFFYISVFGFLVSLFLPVLLWADGSLEKRANIIGTIAFFAFFTYIFRHLRQIRVTVFVDATGIQIPQLNFGLHQNELTSIRVKPVASRGYHLQAQTSKTNFVILVGTVLWAGRYLDITLGKKR